MNWPTAMTISVGMICATVLIFPMFKYTIPSIIDYLIKQLETKCAAWTLGVKPEVK